jgi:hypothetical protein
MSGRGLLLLQDGAEALGMDFDELGGSDMLQTMSSVGKRSAARKPKSYLSDLMENEDDDEVLCFLE